MSNSFDQKEIGPASTVQAGQIEEENLLGRGRELELGTPCRLDEIIRDQGLTPHVEVPGDEPGRSTGEARHGGVMPVRRAMDTVTARPLLEVHLEHVERDRRHVLAIGAVVAEHQALTLGASTKILSNLHRFSSVGVYLYYTLLREMSRPHSKIFSIPEKTKKLWSNLFFMIYYEYSSHFFYVCRTPI